MPSFGLNGLENVTALGNSTLSASIGAGDTSFSVSDAANVAAWPTANFAVRMGDEIMFCDSRSGNTITVNASGRGYAGTTAASHPQNTTVKHVHSPVALQAISDFAAAGVTYTGTPVDNQIAVFTDGDTVEGSSGLTFASGGSGGTNDFKIDNPNNTASSVARSFIAVGGATAGDPFTLYEVAGVTNWATGIDNSDSDKYKISNASALGTNDRVVVDSSGNVGIGTSSPDGTLHAHTATAGAVTASTSANQGVFENSGNGGISILTPAANVGEIRFGSPSDNGRGFISYDHASGSITTEGLGFGVRGGTVFILKSSTVSADGMTANPETDTEAGFITVRIGATDYQWPIYAA